MYTQTQTSLPSRTTLRTAPAVMYTALLGPRCVDVYQSQLDAQDAIKAFPMGWVMELPADAILEDVLEGTEYDNVPLFYAPW
jgi:hypothetical protein